MTQETTRESLRDEGRLVLAFFAIPVLDALVGFCFALVRTYGAADPMDAGLSLAFAFGLVSVLVTVFMVLPIVLGLIEMGPVSLAQLVVTGAVIGTAPLLLIVGMAISNGGNPQEFFRRGFPVGALVGPVLGVASAAAFWVIGIRGTRWAVQPEGGQRHPYGNPLQ